MITETEFLDRLDTLSDPARLDLYDEVALDGPLSERELRTRVPSARAALPYHLSRLQSAKLIKQDTSGAWLIRHNPIEVPAELNDSPAVKTASRIALQVMAERRADRSREWSKNRERKRWAVWSQSFVDRDYIVASMRPEDVDEFGERLHALVTEYRERAPQDGEPVFIAAVAMPLRGCR